MAKVLSLISLLGLSRLIAAARVSAAVANILETPPNLPDDIAPWLEQVSWSPRAYIIHNALTEEEADHIKAIATPYLQRSSVQNPLTGASEIDQVRTSKGMFIPRLFDDVIARVEQRLSRITMLPLENQEEMQVLEYQKGEEYKAHWDFLEVAGKDPLASPDGNRMVTVLHYLSTPEEGGETCFPNGRYLDESLRPDESVFSPCAAKSRGPCVKPKKGDAILFHDMKPDGRTLDPASLHVACPVIKGEKWSAPVWIHNRPFRPDQLNAARLEQPCEDKHAQCATWAKAGECTKNMSFMIGGLGANGSCRKSCGACSA